MAVTTRNYGAARVITAIATIIAAVLLLDILLVWANANGNNDIVHFFMQVGSFFATPFKQLFTVRGHKQDILVNWGIAAVAYLVLGGLLARLSRRGP
jgi:uncharacterized protein YggT (Ycf19 family)